MALGSMLSHTPAVGGSNSPIRLLRFKGPGCTLIIIIIVIMVIITIIITTIILIIIITLSSS